MKLIYILLFLILNFCAQSQNASNIAIDSIQFRNIEKEFILRQQQENKKRDWAEFSKYDALNQSNTRHPKVVFMGNSITEGWVNAHPAFFTSNLFAGRGISGQTSSQMLVRFRSDVIMLKPKIVVINAGTNDIAQNNGTISLEHILQNIISMCELAKVNHIKPVLSSILPANHFWWNKTLKPAQDIVTLNGMIKNYAVNHSIRYVDYYSSLVDNNGGLDTQYSEDGVHPNMKGYSVMEAIILKTLK